MLPDGREARTGPLRRTAKNCLSTRRCAACLTSDISDPKETGSPGVLRFGLGAEERCRIWERDQWLHRTGSRHYRWIGVYTWESPFPVRAMLFRSEMTELKVPVPVPVPIIVQPN